MRSEEFMAWKLSETQQTIDILQVLQQVAKNFSGWQTLSTDGVASYWQAFLQLGNAGTLIQQIHSRPWHDVWVRIFESNSLAVKNFQILLPTALCKANKLLQSVQKSKGIASISLSNWKEKKNSLSGFFTILLLSTKLFLPKII